MVDELKPRELETALDRYARELAAAGRAQATVGAYVYRGHRFLAWRATQGLGGATHIALEADLVRYEVEAHAAYQTPTTAWTYIDGARRFVRWLNDEYHPKGSRSTALPRAGPIGSGASWPVVDLEGLTAARRRYREIEPRDLFYRAAIDLVHRAWNASGGPLTTGEALAVLLFTWNRAFYRYHPPSSDHVDGVEQLITRHRGALVRWRATRLAPEAMGDLPSIEATFNDFEELLGAVGAAKGLHLLAPTFFPIWDRTIAAAYRCGLRNRGMNAPLYVQFMRITADQCARLESAGSAPSDVVKALDEWNYVTFTRKRG